MGIGVLVGRSFGDLLDSFVNDILSPPFAFLNLHGNTFDNTYFVLIPGVSGNSSYITLADAMADGAVTENVGSFMEKGVASSDVKV